MMQYVWILAGLFLPLFPLGVIFNALFQRLCNSWLRAVLLLVWPLPGLLLLQVVPLPESAGLALWALFSAALYAFRAVVVREVGVWAGFLATSAWSLVWIALAAGAKQEELLVHVLAFSLPLAVLVLLSAELERRYESAYAGIVSGVAQAQPRLAALFAITMLAVIGSPLFPAFFALLNGITHAVSHSPASAVGAAVVWLLWSWSGVRLMQQLLVGPVAAPQRADITHGMTAAYGSSLLALLVGGVYVAGMIL